MSPIDKQYSAPDGRGDVMQCTPLPLRREAMSEAEKQVKGNIKLVPEGFREQEGESSNTENLVGETPPTGSPVDRNKRTGDSGDLNTANHSRGPETQEDTEVCHHDTAHNDGSYGHPIS
ncbi:hypothetical protein NDU88_001441 [Pleurodeles waltl]|uniref:Uncharacterized protein n=1 Tax=Pleurodeles waltl TaxID=8319 RepID=A0AAV7WNL5_PLEWA|nr:hypothetical protein NDU88_001441 [Pleurodeles waltl]